MRKFFLLIGFTSFIMLSPGISGQSKIVKGAERGNREINKIKEESDEVTRQVQNASEAVNSVKNNVKTVVAIFEPILRLKLKKSDSPGDSENTSNGNYESQNVNYDSGSSDYVTQSDIDGGVAITTESSSYNVDGTANIGSQNNTKYGCYLDVVRGEVMDDVDAAGNSHYVDLIFTATGYFNEQVPMYAFLTPAYVKDDKFAYNFFKGTKYKDQNIPPATWDEVNESEVAMTSLTPAQFDKIQNNNQLMAVVRQIKGFSQKVESRTKLDGKVLAVKTEMDNRTAYGLICITNHYGTIGSNGYLKIKIKVTGFDSNGDGIPDTQLYE